MVSALYEKLIRYEAILESGDSATSMEDAGLGTTANITTDTLHITGSRSIKFDKIAGDVECAIWKSLGRFNLKDFPAEGELYFSVYIPDITNVVRCGVRLYEDASNYTTFYSAVADLSNGWNHERVFCTDGVQTGAGVNWHSVKYVGFVVEFSLAANTLADILLDSIRIQIPMAVEATVEASNITIGSVTCPTILDAIQNDSKAYDNIQLTYVVGGAADGEISTVTYNSGVTAVYTLTMSYNAVSGKLESVVRS